MTMLPDTWLLVSAGGFFIGVLIGLTGVGGGSLTTPMLISGFGVPPAIAVGTDLLFASITKASAAWRHHMHGNVDWPIFGYMASGSLTSTLLTLAWFEFASPDTEALANVIRSVLVGALVLSALAVSLLPWWLKRKGGKLGLEVAPRPAPTILYGLVIGALVTITSVGAGAIGVAVLTLLYPSLMARKIVGTDIVHAIPVALLSGLGHLAMGNVEFSLLAALLIGSLPGIMLGSRLGTWVPDWLLRLLLSAVLFYAAYLVRPGGAAH